MHRDERQHKLNDKIMERTYTFKIMERTYTFKINAIKDGEAIEEEAVINGYDELGIMTELQCKYPLGDYWQVKATLIKQEFKFNQFD